MNAMIMRLSQADEMKNVVSITGRSFDGRSVAERALPTGSADHQLTRPDGVVVCERVTHSNPKQETLISVTNKGFRHGKRTFKRGLHTMSRRVHRSTIS